MPDTEVAFLHIQQETPLNRLSKLHLSHMALALGVALGAASAFAQAPAWKQGMPASMASSTLAPCPES